MKMDYDVIVVGSGPGGYVAAIRCAQLGLRTACIEKSATFGGTCLNVGCIPSKALLESSHRYHQVLHNNKEHGIEVDNCKYDLRVMMKRKDSVVDSITKGVDYLLKKNKVATIRATAKLKDKNTVSLVDSDGKRSEVTADNIILASGSQVIELPFAKFDHKLIIDSTDALSLKKPPKHLVVVGGGVIGLELGSVWSRLGSKVTVIEALDNILTNTDRQIADTTQKILTKQGLDFHLGARLEKIKVNSSSEAIVYYKKANKTLEIKCDKVLIAVGRKANTADLGVQDLGIATNNNGLIEINSKWQSTISNIYAIGDITSGPMLAHRASEEAMAVAEVIAQKPGHVNYNAIPNVVYTWPEVATVGLSEQECKDKNISYKVGIFHFKASGRAKAMGETEGMAKAIADAKSDKLLGFHIVGAGASEMIAEIVIAMEYCASAEDIARSVHAHPTLAEIMKEAALSVDKRAIHS
jgi:dihydrolipoamide dehydrogenase